MLKKGIFLAVCSLAISSSAVHAGGDIAPAVVPIEPVPVKKLATPVYLGVGFVAGRYHESNYEDVTYGGMVRIGYEYNQYWGIEARYISTFADTGDLYGQDLEHIGLFVKPTLSLGDDFNIYGLLGYGWMQTETTGGLNSAIDEHGFSAGAGLEYDLSDKRDDYDRNIYYPEGFDGQADQEKGWGLFVDYQRLLIKSDIPELDAISAGVTYDF
jgi:opacity protein-like surface antigen